jgi:hypothetical protein
VDLLPQQEVCVIHVEVTVIARVAFWHSLVALSLPQLFKWNCFTLL